jgi:toxin ParE1/3/4
MAAAKRLRHQVAAHRDLLDIWSYTRATWSEEQADAYLAEIDATFHGLCTGELAGTRHAYRLLKRRVRSHVIYYRDNGREIVVVRVLHGRMDAPRHLRE